MGLTVKSLGSQTLNSTTPSMSYTPAAGKGALVKSILLVNTAAGASTATAVLQNGNSGSTFNICPPAISIPQGGMLELTAEISLSYIGSNGDKITITRNSGTIDCVVSGVERDN
jgi:hypothetical protein